MRATKILYREFWGETKRADLLAKLQTDADIDAGYVMLQPTGLNRFNLRRAASGSAYADWVALPELARREPQNGLMEKRGGALIDHDRAALERRMRAYFDHTRSFDQVAGEIGALSGDRARFAARQAREAVLPDGFRERALQRYWLRPFEIPWSYVTARRPVWNEPRPQLQHMLPDAAGFVVTRPAAVADPEGWPVCWTPLLGDNDALRGHAYYLPVIENLSGAPRPNLSPAATRWLGRIGLPIDPDAARQVWHHALAITYSPAWLTENAEAIRQGWPRIPLPNSADLLVASAALGERVAALLDPDVPVPGVTQGKPRPELAGIAVPATAPGASRDWSLTGWGHRTEKGVTMPGRGRTEERAYAASEAATAAQSALLGATTRDVWMNGASFWRNIPKVVWETHIGGYQVLKKWLSYRDHSILGRPLTEAEVQHVQATARRLAALRLMGPDLDASFRACAAAHMPLPG